MCDTLMILWWAQTAVIEVLTENLCLIKLLVAYRLMMPILLRITSMHFKFFDWNGCYIMEIEQI